MKKLLATFVLAFAYFLLFSPDSSLAASCDYTVNDVDGLLSAKNTIRGLTNSMTQDIVVCLRDEKKYYLDSTISFDSRDSGRNGHKVIYKNYQNEKPIISGGGRITGWKSEGNGIYSASVGSLEFRQLYVNGQRAIRAREPNKDQYYRLKEWDVNNKKIKINSGETVKLPLNSDKSKLNQVEMIVHKHWTISVLRLDSYSASGGDVYIVSREPERNLTFSGNPPERSNQSYHFENAMKFLDKEGEWHLDTQANKVFYKPYSGQNMSQAIVFAPRLETLIKIQGTPGSRVSNLQFYGLTFEHTTWMRSSEQGFVGRQANHYRWGTIPGGINVEFAQNLRFERNVLRHMGGSGLVLYQGTRDTKIIGNVVKDISGGGIAIEDRAERDAIESEICKRDLVQNNYITRVGRDYSGSIGIFGGYPDSAIIEHNEIHDLPYTGISVGWGWTLNDTPLRNNKIRYNHIYNAINLLDDGAGIYTLSKQPGTLIAENYIHDLIRSPWADPYWIAGIYLDNGSDYITVLNNVVDLDLSQYRVRPFTLTQYRRGENNDFGGGVNQPPGINGPPGSFDNWQAVVDNAGLEPEYQDIKEENPTPTPTPSPTTTPTPIPTVESMMISNFADFHDASPEDFATTKFWTLTAGEGEKTVWVKFKWSDGAWTDPVFDTITFNTPEFTPTPTTPLTPTPTPTLPPEVTPTPTPTPTSAPTPTPTPTPGLSAYCRRIDLNGNGVVDILDWSLMVGMYGQTGEDLPGDFNGDGEINILDFSAFIETYNWCIITAPSN